MLDNIREWISDNLRWILLGVAAVLLVVIAVFAVRLVTHLGSGGSENSSPSGTTQTEQVTEGQTASAGTTLSTGTLTRDQADVLAAATDYWTAIANQDYDTLEKLCAKTFDEAERAQVESMDRAVESYDSITTYSKAGLTEGSYVVYVYIELKLTGIATAGPTIRELYMETSSDGSLTVIQPDDYTAEISAYTAERQADSDVQALLQDVNDTLAQRCEQDADLQQYVESSQTPAADSTDSSGSETEGETGSTAAGTATGTMYVNVEGGANVRSEASTDGSVYGTLVRGAQVEVLENLDNGWSRIQYIDGSGSAVEGYIMTEFLSAQ